MKTMEERFDAEDLPQYAKNWLDNAEEDEIRVITNCGNPFRETEYKIYDKGEWNEQ